MSPYYFELLSCFSIPYYYKICSAQFGVKQEGKEPIVEILASGKIKVIEIVKENSKGVKENE